MSMFDKLINQAKTFLHIATADASTVASQADTITTALENGQAVESVIAKAESYVVPAEKLIDDLKALFTRYSVPDVEALIGDTLALMGKKQVQAAAQVEGSQKVDAAAQ